MSNPDAIKQFLIEEFMPDVSASELSVETDMLSEGVIDSLGMLKLIAWIEEKFSLPVSDTELDPDNFRSIAAIDAFIERTRADSVAGG